MAVSITTRCTIDAKPIRDFQTMVVQDMNSRGGSVGNVIMEKWPGSYFEFLRRRYRTNAAGGGDWAPLSRRTRAKGGQRKGIMRVTDTIYNSLTPGNPGNMVKQLPNGVRCGIAGGAGHPVAGIEIGRLTAILSKDSRDGMRPGRPIIVTPDAETIKRMQIQADRGFAAFIRKFSATVGASKKFVAKQAGVNVPRNR